MLDEGVLPLSGISRRRDFWLSKIPRYLGSHFGNPFLEIIHKDGFIVVTGPSLPFLGESGEQVPSPAVAAKHDPEPCGEKRP